MTLRCPNTAMPPMATMGVQVPHRHLSSIDREGASEVQVASDALRAGYSAGGGRAGLAEAHFDGRPVLRGVMFSQLAAERLR